MECKPDIDEQIKDMEIDKMVDAYNEQKKDIEEDFKVVFTCLVKAKNMEYAIAKARDEVNNSKKSELNSEWL